MASGRPRPGARKGTPRLLAADVEAGLRRHGPSYIREARPSPAFAVGDRVRARNINPPGHTRLPRYARGHVGLIERVHGAHVFPDSHAHGPGRRPASGSTRCVHGPRAVGPDARHGDSVRLDLWEPYLERA